MALGAQKMLGGRGKGGIIHISFIDYFFVFCYDDNELLCRKGE